MSVELRRARVPVVVLAGGVALALISIALLASRMNINLPWHGAYQVHVAVDSARGIQPGKQEVRWAGVTVGRITAVTLRDGRPVLTATIDKAPSGARIYRDARLRLRPQTPLEDMQLDVESRGHRSAGELRHDDVLAADRTRTPVFIGDDFTDEAGISAAKELGGIGLRVGEAFGGDPAHVRAWLKRGSERMAGREKPDTLPTGISL